MFGNYLASAIRALQRDKFHTLLNIVGLTVSLAVTFLITLYVKHELSYENFFTEPERVYTVQSQYRPVGNEEPLAPYWLAPYGLFTALEANFEDQLTSTFVFAQDSEIRFGENIYRERINAIDEHFFEVFDYPILYSKQVEALVEPDKVALTESMALQLFGSSNSTGESLNIGGRDMEVVIVLEDSPSNTDLPHHDIFVSSATYASAFRGLADLWINSVGYLSVRLNDDSDMQAIESQLPALIDRHMPTEQRSIVSYSPSFIRLDQIHFGIEGYENHRTSLAMLICVAFFLCAIACFNYINLSTAKALTRFKEVGVRKILGAKKFRLAAQFLSETFLTTFLSFFLAFALAFLLLPIFSSMVDRPLTNSDFLSPFYFLILLVLTLVINLLSGTYSAFFLASAKSIQLFDKQRISSGRHSVLRSIMVSAQFSMTVGLIVAASVVYAQAAHMGILDLGFDEKGILVTPNLPQSDEEGLREVYKRRLAESPYIQIVASSVFAPRVDYDSLSSFSRPQHDRYERLAVHNMIVGDSFFELYRIPTLAGRIFSESLGDRTFSQLGSDDSTDAGKILISKSMLPYFGFGNPEDAVGQVLVRHLRDNDSSWEIIGVVPDIHMRLAHSPIQPMVYFYEDTESMDVISARVAPSGEEQAVAHAQMVWEELFPDNPFEYEFLEDRVEAANADENRISKLFIFLTGLTILVTCLGLFGLVSFTATRRTREIAIRKVVGARVGDVTKMLLWEFTKPILLASLVAWPIVWLFMRNWLDGFPYRIELSLWFFIGATTLALSVAFLTVIGRTWKAAQTHPAQALKYE